MKIAICGAGMAGSYLYKLLKNEGKHELQVFDRTHETACGINPCAWGTSKGFEDLVKFAGLNPEDYIIMRHDHVMMDEMMIKAYALTINKPKLIRDLLDGAEVIDNGPKEESKEPRLFFTQDFDRVIDATGVARAYLPPIKDDIILPCVQYRMLSENYNELKIKISKIGYAWSFPQSETIFHIGAGSFVTNPEELINEMLRKNKNKNPKRDIICACQSKVRVTAPSGSQPFICGDEDFNLDGSLKTKGEIWGVGESIGCCAPLAGEGIIPGMRSAQILAQNLNKPEAYRRAILSEFAWMEDERRVLDRLIKGENIGIRSGWTLMRTTKRMNMKLSLWQALKVLRRAKK